MGLLEDKFSEWYSLVVPKAEKEQVNARLASVSDLSKGLKQAQVPQLIRQFYRLPVDTAYVETLRKALDAKDGKYIPSEDAAELAVIAAATVCLAVAKPSHIADAVALGVSCVEAAGMRKAERIDAVVVQCRQYLLDEGVRVREEKKTIPKLATDAFLTGIKGLPPHYPAGLPTYGEALDGLLVSFAGALDKYAKDLGEFIEGIERLRTEESTILYWILGERTVDGVRYSELDIKKACMFVAVDLAHLTGDLPGPISAPVFMQKMLAHTFGESAKASITTCVDALDPTQRQSIATTFVPKDAVLMPILFAVAKSVESGGTGWTSAFSTQTGLEPQRKMEPIRIAEQLYSELLLLRAIS